MVVFDVTQCNIPAIIKKIFCKYVEISSLYYHVSIIMSNALVCIQWILLDAPGGFFFYKINFIFICRKSSSELSLPSVLGSDQGILIY